MSAVDFSGLIQGFGSEILLAIIFLTFLIIAGLKNGIHGAALVVILLPLTLQLAFTGYLPQPLAFLALFLAGFLTYYVIREIIGGGWR